MQADAKENVLRAELDIRIRSLQRQPIDYIWDFHRGEKRAKNLYIRDLVDEYESKIRLTRLEILEPVLNDKDRETLRICREKCHENVLKQQRAESKRQQAIVSREIDNAIVYLKLFKREIVIYEKWLPVIEFLLAADDGVVKSQYDFAHRYYVIEDEEFKIDSLTDGRLFVEYGKNLSDMKNIISKLTELLDKKCFDAIYHEKHNIERHHHYIKRYLPLGYVNQYRKILSMAKDWKRWGIFGTEGRIRREQRTYWETHSHLYDLLFNSQLNDYSLHYIKEISYAD